MLVIAHWLSTVERAGNIVMLKQERKIGEGAYQELREGHSKFRLMA
jgi:ABC-type multidrug transport system fused ATPase/permease subunit